MKLSTEWVNELTNLRQIRAAHAAAIKDNKTKMIVNWMKLIYSTGQQAN